MITNPSATSIRVRALCFLLDFELELKILTEALIEQHAAAKLSTAAVHKIFGLVERGIQRIIEIEKRRPLMAKPKRPIQRPRRIK